MIDSISLPNIEVNETGRYFSGLLLDPFLKIGVTLARRQSWGTIPDLIELSNSSARGYEITLTYSFKNLAEILSGPGADVDLSLLILMLELFFGKLFFGPF